MRLPSAPNDRQAMRSEGLIGPLEIDAERREAMPDKVQAQAVDKLFSGDFFRVDGQKLQKQPSRRAVVRLAKWSRRNALQKVMP